MTIIEQLKTNKEAFGLMSEEMQEKAKGIGIINFQYWNFGWGTCQIRDWDDGACYRLRPGYTEGPEIVECEIYESLDGHIHYRENASVGRMLSVAVNNPDFIGFKFEDGKLYPISTVYKFKDKTITYYSVDLDKLGKYAVLHATHVLFRGQK